VVNKDETLEAIIAGAKANGSWDKKYPDDDKKAQPAQEPTSGDYAMGYAEGFNDACKKPAQEPVAYCYVQKGTSVDILTFDAEPDDAVEGTLFPLYTTPQPKAQTACCAECGRKESDGWFLYCMDCMEKTNV